VHTTPTTAGITLAEAESDPHAEARRSALIKMAADTLDDHKMIRYDPGSGNLAATDLGRSASHFYIKHESVYRFNGAMKVCSSAATVDASTFASHYGIHSLYSIAPAAAAVFT
jgi:activating signal cointegrator complex subunit 3